MDQLIKKYLSISSSVKIVQPTVDQPEIIEEDENQSEPANFAYTFRPIYFLSRVFGYMPFSIAWSSKEKYYVARIRPIDGLWFVSIIFVYLLMSIFTYRRDDSAMKDKLPNLCIPVGRTYQTLSLFFCVAIIVTDMINRFKIIGILNLFNRFDEEVGNTLGYNIYLSIFNILYVSFS